MSARPIAYVMEQTLGNITHYLNIRRAEALSGTPSSRWLPIAYQPGVLPWTVTGGWLTRKALLPILSEVDGVFIHGDGGICIGQTIGHRPMGGDALPIEQTVTAWLQKIAPLIHEIRVRTSFLILIWRGSMVYPRLV